MCKSVKLYQLGSEFIKINPKTITGPFRVKVMDSTIYSIQRVVIKELSNLAFYCVFITHC